MLSARDREAQRCVDRFGAQRQRRCARVQVCREGQEHRRAASRREKRGERRKEASSVCHVKIWHILGQRGEEKAVTGHGEGGGGL